MLTSLASRFPVALSVRTIAYSAAMVLGAAIVLFGTRWAFGAPVAQACYLAIMLLLSPARALQVRVRILAAGWAVLVSIAGFLVGSLGLWPTLVGLIAVCLVQGFFRLGEVASMTRSPANFIAFAGIATTDAALWHVVLGSVLGALFMLCLAWAMPEKEPLPPASTTPLERLEYGLMLAAGSIVIVLLAEWLDFQFASWALLSFCLVLAVGTDNRRSRARDRMIGTIVGAVCATLATLLPAPVPLAIAGLSMFLCVAYLRAGNYTLFVTFLTPAILLTTSSELSALSVGIGRVEAVLGSIIVAVGCSWTGHFLSSDRRVSRGHAS